MAFIESLCMWCGDKRIEKCAIPFKQEEKEEHRIFLF